MDKIGIIGIGHVGSTLAYTLLERHVACELYLFDEDQTRCKAEQQDLICSQIGREQTAKVFIGQEQDLKTLDILIFAAGNIALLNGSGTRFDELNFTKQAAAQWAKKIVAQAFNGILLVITNPCDVITNYMQTLTNLPHHQVIGTGTSLDTARLKHAISEYFQCDPNTIQALVLGEHGETQFFPWTLIKQLNPTLEFTPESERLLTTNALALGETTFTGKGFTSFGIANQAAQLVQAILCDTRALFPVSAYVEKEDLYIGQLARIGRKGLYNAFSLPLSESEQIAYQHSIDWIREMTTHI